MKAETADYMAKARVALSDAQQIATLPLPHVAAREAYLAVFHTAHAYIFEQTGKIPKTHGGVWSQFAELAKAEPRIGRDLVTFLSTSYQFKARADYAIGPKAAPISPAERPAPTALNSRRVTKGKFWDTTRITTHVLAITAVYLNKMLVWLSFQCRMRRPTKTHNVGIM